MKWEKKLPCVDERHLRMDWSTHPPAKVSYWTRRRNPSSWQNRLSLDCPPCPQCTKWPCPDISFLRDEAICPGLSKVPRFSICGTNTDPSMRRWWCPPFLLPGGVFLCLQLCLCRPIVSYFIYSLKGQLRFEFYNLGQCQWSDPFCWLEQSA